MTNPPRHPVIASLVEGHGEETAVPVLLRRVVAFIDPYAYAETPRPLRVPRDALLRKPQELEVRLRAAESHAPTAVLVLLDSDDDCPVALAQDLNRRAAETRPDLATYVVLPVREFEAWFLAGASGLAGRYGLPVDLKPPPDPESIRGAKEWFSERMPQGAPYQPTAHQAGFAHHFDLAAARAASRSFAKVCRDVATILSSTPQNSTVQRGN